MVKTNYKSESFRGSMCRTKTTKITTIILGIAGCKQKFYSSNNDQVKMIKKVDSLMKWTAKSDTNIKPRSHSVN